MTGKFPGSFPDGCPTDGAQVDATIFRGCEENPPSDEDFTPHALSAVSKKKKRGERAGCAGWGLSVWVSEEDAKHAQELFDWAARWHIFKGDVTADDGKLAPTPSNSQANHHTFWCFEGVCLKDRFIHVLPPYEGASA